MTFTPTMYGIGVVITALVVFVAITISRATTPADELSKSDEADAKRGDDWWLYLIVSMVILAVLWPLAVAGAVAVGVGWLLVVSCRLLESWIRSVIETRESNRRWMT